MTHFLEKNIGMLRSQWRSLAVFSYDLLAVIAAWLGAYALRFNFAVAGELLSHLLAVLIYLVPVQAVVFRLTGLYRGLWFFSSLPDLVRIAKAIGISGLLMAAMFPFINPAGIAMDSVILLYPVLLFLLMTGGRAAYRVSKEYGLHGRFGTQGHPVLVLGAGRAGARLVQELAHSQEWHVSGFLDDDHTKHGREIMGRRVFGSTAQLAEWAPRLGVRHAILAIPSASDAVVQRLSGLCVQSGVDAYTVPSTVQLISGQGSLNHLRPIKLDDLLGRSPVDIDNPDIRSLVTDRVIMVTGAGGSIGSELCRQIARLRPALIILFENNEYALYALNEELSDQFPEIATLPIAGDVKDAVWVGDLMRRHTPAVVFHAAAYKHVPLMEKENAWQAVRNNVYGTYVVALAALRAKVPEFVLVSTDKAVNPTNVMGASKRLAEMVCQVLQSGQKETRFEIVRFGNVLGSTGSVIPKFQKQIRMGGPITVTHPEVTRFFMSIPEAAQLVLQAAAMGEGGEIFVLDMGQPVRIFDLARQMIRLTGRREDEIPIIFTGLRPGEKLYEELLAIDEETRSTHHPKVRIAKARPVPESWLDEMLVWLKSATPRTDDEVRRDLRRWVPEYQPAILPSLRPVSILREK